MNIDPKSVISDMEYCSQCAGHDDHEHCERNYIVLEKWMEQVEKRLRQLEAGRAEGAQE